MEQGTPVGFYRTSFLCSKDENGKTQEQAKDICEHLGAKLPVVTSINMRDAMNNCAYNSQYRWIGLDKVKNHWKWESGENYHDDDNLMAMSNSNWQYKCAMTGSNVIYREPCTNSYRVACQVDDWNRYENAEYWVYKTMRTFIAVKNDSLSFDMATRKCESLKANLAAPTSLEEMKIIDNIIARLEMDGEGAFWLGAKKREHYGSLPQWLTGEYINDNLRNITNDNGGHCLVYSYGKERAFDYRECDRERNEFEPTPIKGVLCQIVN